MAEHGFWMKQIYGTIFILTVCSATVQRAYKCKEIDVAIFKTSLMKMLLQDKMLLRIKICKWSGFQFVSLTPGKTFVLSKASNNNHINYFLFCQPPSNNWQTYCQNKNCPMDLSWSYRRGKNDLFVKGMGTVSCSRGLWLTVMDVIRSQQSFSFWAVSVQWCSSMYTITGLMSCCQDLHDNSPVSRDSLKRLLSDRSLDYCK